MPGRGPDAATPVPGALNLVLLASAAALAGTLLWAASHAGSGLALVAAAVGFSYVNNTLFALLHEATHGVFHVRRRVNDWGGRLAAAFFPTSYTMQRAFHLTHHRHNRTVREQFDYFRPGDHRVLKLAQWYAIVTGVYWVFVPLGCLLYGLAPWVLRLGWLRRADSTVAAQTGAESYLGSVDRAPGSTIRAEILLAALIQGALVWGLDLSLAGWACCYGAFALNWSSLQYADHAWSPLHVRDGAWNLRVNPVVRLLFLNYHHHLAHHRQPTVPWIHLPRFVDPVAPRPAFWRIYLRMWRGPRPLPAGAGPDPMPEHA